MDFAQLKIEKCHQEKQALASNGSTSNDLFAKSLILTYFKSWVSVVKNNFAKQLHFFPTIYEEITISIFWEGNLKNPLEPDVNSKGNSVGCRFDSGLPDTKCPMAQRGAINMPESRRGTQILLTEEHRLRNPLATDLREELAYLNACSSGQHAPSHLIKRSTQIFSHLPKIRKRSSSRHTYYSPLAVLARKND